MSIPAWPHDADLLGARPIAEERTRFTVWAPNARQVEVVVEGGDVVPLERSDDGYHGGLLDDCPPGTRYRFRLDGGDLLADPASRRQPEGVHGPSEVVAPGAFRWRDDGWRGIRMTDLVLYELHVGTYTEEGTFDGAAQHLEDLAALGVTCVELMPVASFPGRRNWGYDGVFLFAVQESYGGPEGLRRFVDAAHRHGIAVCLDVVYNHVGPEGNVLPRYGPYFTERYKTPWGTAPNLDGADSDEVRRFFIENARHWVTEHHIDALRLDAVHAIVDPTPLPFLEELAERVHARAEQQRRVALVISESDANDPRIVRPQALGGMGHDGVWADDFHHALHVALTGEGLGYYADYAGLHLLADALRRAFVFTGQHNGYRGRRHGAAPVGVPPERFVVFAQNHDQVGNRADGARLLSLVGPAKARVAAALVVLSPFVPLLFMGEEHGETRPFHFFVDHGDAALIEAVREGRTRELAAFGWGATPRDPQAETTFAACRIDHGRRREAEGLTWFRYHQALLGLRRDVPAIGPHGGPHAVEVHEPSATITLTRTRPGGSQRASAVWMALRLGAPVGAAPVPPPGVWRRRLATDDAAWGGDGPRAPERLWVPEDRAREGEALTLGPWSMTVYVREGEVQR